MVSWTIVPHGVEGLTVPVHPQLKVPALNVAPTFDPPGPNCTLTLLLVSDHPAGMNIMEMLPVMPNVRLTDGSPPVGEVMLKNICGGGMVDPSQLVSDAKSVETA
jgi:hypothetical protein